MENKKARLYKYEEDSIIVREGEVPKEMYKILKGNVALYLNYGTAEEYFLGVYSEGRCFGELGVLYKQPSSYTAVAVNEVLMFKVAEDEMTDFLHNNANNALDIIKSLGREVLNLKENIEMLLDELAAGNENEKQTSQRLQSQLKKMLKEDYVLSLSLVKKEEEEK